MNTNEIGDISQAMVLASLLKRGYVVLVPYGAHLRYDLVIERDGTFLRVQCKTGRLMYEGTTIQFPTSSPSVRGSNLRKTYRGAVDLFGVYCHGNNKAYLVPVEDVPDKMAHLKLEKPKNNQVKGIRWASDYEI